jgi:hypothetical protein
MKQHRFDKEFKGIQEAVQNTVNGTLSEAKSADIDMSKEMEKLYNNAVKSIATSVKAVKGVEKIRQVDKVRGTYNIFIINAMGYTRSDFEAECTIVINFRKSGANSVRIDAKRPDWGKYEVKQMDEEFTDIIPVNKILTYVNQTFGVDK